MNTNFACSNSNARSAVSSLASLLLFATPETALRRLGQSRQAAAGVGAWRPRPLPQLGLGRARSAPALPHYRARPSRPRRLRLGRGQRLFDDRLRARSLTADERGESGSAQ